jgi:PKD repeat protein
VKKNRAFPVLVAAGVFSAILLPASAAFAQASASAGHPDNEGCWCGFQTNVVRNYVIRGTSSTAAHKEGAADMIREWNRFVNLFSVSVDSSSNLGSPNNGVNEVNVFISNADSVARYGIKMDANLFGRAIIFPKTNFTGTPYPPGFDQCKEFRPDGCGPFTETDVIVNAEFPTGWTGDWFAAGDDQQSGPALVQTTVLHEVGHTLGLHHVFDLDSGAGYENSFSTMNYLNDDVGKFVTRIDSKTVRTEYPGASRSLVDVGIFPFVYGNTKYKQFYAAASKTSLLPGESFTLSNWLIQNVGSQPAGAIRVTFYLFPAGSRPYPQPGDVAVGIVDFSGGAAADSEGDMNGTPLAVPPSLPAGDYWLGAIVTVGGAEDSPFVAGKPNNNRFVVGHNPATAIRVLQGSGGGTPLAADFQFAPTNPQAGQTVSFQDLSRGNPTGWLWDFGDPGSGGSNASSARNPEHVFAQAGTYSVRLTVSASGTPSNSTTRSVVVAAKPGAGTSSSALFIPIVLDLPGRFSSELTLTNSGTTTATVRLRYTAAPTFGGAGTGSMTRTLGPGQQVVVADAIAYLRQNGLQIPTGSNQGGSLRVEFEGLSNGAAGNASVRTTAPIAGVGRAGLSYAGVDVTKAFKEPVAIFGLRQNAADRSNLALANASTTSPVTLTVYVVKGDGTSSIKFDPLTLQPGEWNQYNNILTQADSSFSEGWILIEPSSSAVPFLAYGVFNDNGTNDGSYVPAIPDSEIDALLGVPVIVEVGDRFSSELMLTNLSDKPAQAYIEFVESLATPGGASTGVFYLDLKPLEQVLIPNVVDELRLAGASVGPRGGSYAGSLSVLFSDSSGMTPGLAGVRTSNPSTTGPGRYGLFYPGVSSNAAARDAWVYGLQQNGLTRTNLAVVNAGLANAPIKVRLEIYNGTTGSLVSRQTLEALQPGQWRQYDRLLQQFAPGVENAYARLTVVEGVDSFFAYSVLNDGPAPNTGTSDGSYVPMVKSN